MTRSNSHDVATNLPDGPTKRIAGPGRQDESASPRAVAVQNTDGSSNTSQPPINVLAAYHKPLKHKARYGHPTCDLQLRSYSVRNLEFMADFALRAAYYLKLPATGPVPLPKRVERWTVIRSNFVHKKSQENFERITLKRLIQIQDGHRDAVEVWLSFLRRHQFYGVGMKANIWHHESLDVANNMDKQLEEVQQDLDKRLGLFGWNQHAASSKTVTEMLQQQGPRQVGVPMTYLREESQTVNNKM